MIVCRQATPDDLPALAEMALRANQPIEGIPSLMFICEDTEDDSILGMAGIYLNTPGMVVVGGYIVPPEVYADRELRRAVAEDIKNYLHAWLLLYNCKAYVCNVSKRNTRMQRWLERRGAKRYAKKNGSYWYIMVIDSTALEGRAA
jgi:hypothetical protein